MSMHQDANNVDLRNKADLPWSKLGEFDGNDNITFDIACIKKDSDSFEVVYALRGGKDYTDDDFGFYNKLNVLLSGVGTLLEDAGYVLGDIVPEYEGDVASKGEIASWFESALADGHRRMRGEA